MTWITQFERKAKYANLKPEDWLRFVGQNIAVAHSQAFDDLFDKYKDRDWSEFKAEFI